ncbi:hypothetical protein B4U84_15455 [Westiellopsis prolifica IICB1]|nr:hypothetical protein B4U84_15455 [Westiellopsis prolifica IICB1]
MVLLHERHRLIKQIGQGGDCQTFIAVDEGQSLPFFCVVQQFAKQDYTPETFGQTAQRLEELGKHPQIPKVISYFAENDHFYLVQELIEGKNLAALVEEQGAFNETQIWQLLESLLPVIKFISDRYVIHCDIKPENIILGSSGRFTKENLFLVDFSTAKLLSEQQISAAKSLVSPEYAAPEQIQGHAVFASDLYSLGVTCIYLLTHISPFDLFDIANNCWIWQQYLTVKVSDRLVKILDKLIEIDLSHRFQSADEVMQALGIYLPQNQLLASASFDRTIRLWDLSSLHTQTHKKIENCPCYSLSGHAWAVLTVAFSPDGKILATGSDDNTIKLWDVNTGQVIHTLLGHSWSVLAVAFSADGETLISGSRDNTLKFWRVCTGEQIATLTGHVDSVTTVVVNPVAQIIVSGSRDKTIKLWQL